MASSLPIKKFKPLKSALYSVFWITAALLYWKFSEKDAGKFAEAFFILTSFSLLTVTAKFVAWHAIGRQPAQNFLQEIIQEKFWLLILCILVSALFAIHSFWDILARRIYTIAEFESDSFIHLLSLAAENWWLVMVLTIVAIASFAVEFQSILRTNQTVENVKEKINVKMTFCLFGYLLLMMTISAYFNSEDESYLLLLLTVILFLPWDEIFKLIMKLHHRYWKLN